MTLIINFIIITFVHAYIYVANPSLLSLLFLLGDNIYHVELFKCYHSYGYYHMFPSPLSVLIYI